MVISPDVAIHRVMYLAYHNYMLIALLIFVIFHQRVLLSVELIANMYLNFFVEETVFFVFFFLIFKFNSQDLVISMNNVHSRCQVLKKHQI